MNIRATDAYLELRVIVAALNEYWNPIFVKGEFQYYPFFVFVVKKKLIN